MSLKLIVARGGVMSIVLNIRSIFVINITLPSLADRLSNASNRLGSQQ